MTQECGLLPPDPPEYMATANAPTVHYISACVKVCIRQSSDVTKYHHVSSNIVKCHQITISLFLILFGRPSLQLLSCAGNSLFSINIFRRRLKPQQQGLERRTLRRSDGCALCTHCAASPMDPWMPRLPPRSS